MFATISVNPIARTRPCHAVDAGHVHGDVPCTQAAVIHCRRSGADVCGRHENGHAAATGCGQGEHELIPRQVPAAVA